MDPFSILGGLSAAKGLFDLFGSRKSNNGNMPSYQAPGYSRAPAYSPYQGYQQVQRYQGPTYAQSPRYNAPAYGAAPQYQGLSQDQVNQAYQMSPLYQQALSAYQAGSQNGYLPQSYRDSVLSQARRELGYQQDLDQGKAVEDANKYNLLGSGSLAVRQGMIDNNYARQYGNIVDSMNQQDLGERSNLRNLIAGQESNLLNLANQQNQLANNMGESNWQFTTTRDQGDARYGDQAARQENQFGANMALNNAQYGNQSDREQQEFQNTSGRQDNQYGYSQLMNAIQNENAFNQQNAMNQYQAQLNQARARSNMQDTGMNNLMNAAGWFLKPEMDQRQARYNQIPQVPQTGNRFQSQWFNAPLGR